MRTKLGAFNYNKGAPLYNKEKLVFKPLIEFEEGKRYKGEWNEESGLREGKGYLIDTDGEIYEGFFLNGIQCGRGRLI